MFDISRTHWSQIHAVGGGRPGTQDEMATWEGAWEYLTRRFQPFMQIAARNALRSYGASPGDAEDVVQSFFHHCLQKDWLARAAPQFGRFRSFVSVLLRRFTRKYVDEMRAKKRAPQGGWTSLESVLDGYDPVARESVDDESLAEWVRILLQSANEAVRERSRQNAGVNAELLRDPTLTLQEVAERAGVDSEQIALVRHRAKRMLMEELRTLIGGTVASRTDLTVEYDHLRPLFERYGIELP